MSIIYLALGTNLGDCLVNLRMAIDSFEPKIRVIRESGIYETPPWGYENQANFLNMVVEAETSLNPRALLVYLKNREKTLGRVQSFQNGPRLIDLDILFYDYLILEEDDLVIPHPRLHERAFVLVPLAEIAGEFEHPVFSKKIGVLLDNLDAEDVNKITLKRTA